MKPTITRRGLLLTLGILLMAGGSAGYAYAGLGQHARQGQVIYHTTGTSTAPSCQDLARQYGDDGLTCP